MKTRRAIITLMMAAILSLASCQAQAGELRSLPQWVRDLIEPIELAWLDMWERAVDSLQEVQSPAADVTLRTFAAPPAVELPDVKADLDVTLRANEQGVRPQVCTTGMPLSNHTSHPQPIFPPALTTGAVSANQGIHAAGPVHAPAAEVQPVTNAVMPDAAGVVTAVDGSSGPVAVVAPQGLAEAVVGIETVAPSVPGISLSTVAGVAFPRVSANQDQIALVDTEVLTVLNGIRSLTAKGAPSEQQCSEWLLQRSVSRELLARAIAHIPVAIPIDPVYAPMCAVLWKETDHNLATCIHFPPRTQFFMGVYLGMLGREAEARELLSAITTDDQIVASPLYFAAESLQMARKSLGTSIWAWKRGATMRGPGDQAIVSNSIFLATLMLPNRDDALRNDFIPWAEEALGRPGSESLGWDSCIAPLVLAYVLVGEPAKGIDRGLCWLEKGRQRHMKVSQLPVARLYIAGFQICLGRYTDAMPTLTDLMESAPAEVARAAQGELKRLSTQHPELFVK